MKLAVLWRLLSDEGSEELFCSRRHVGKVVAVSMAHLPSSGGFVFPTSNLFKNHSKFVN